MPDWLTNGLPEISVLWLLISSILGGIIGASFKFVFENLLPQHFTQRREVIEVKRKYSTPILLAADQLRKRLRNVIEHIDEIEKEKDEWLPKDPNVYYYSSTLYIVAHFLGWQQILRHEVVYLDFTTTKETQTFEAFMRGINRGFSEPQLLGKKDSKDKTVVSYDLQSIGDSMIVKEDGRRHAMNYASFVKFLAESNDEHMRACLDEVGELFAELKASDIRFRRIVAIHTIVNAFVEYADPNHLRTEKRRYYLDSLEKGEADNIKRLIGSINPKSLNRMLASIARSNQHSAA